MSTSTSQILASASRTLPFLPVLLVLWCSPAASAAASLPDVVVVALGPADGRAVIKTQDGRMQVLKVGDSLAGTEARLLQVLDDRVVLEVPVSTEGREVVRDLVWVFKADARGRSQQQWLSRTAPRVAPALAPH